MDLCFCCFGIWSQCGSSNRPFQHFYQLGQQQLRLKGQLSIIFYGDCSNQLIGLFYHAINSLYLYVHIPQDAQLSHFLIVFACHLAFTMLSIQFNYSIILHHLMIDNRGTVAFNQKEVKANQCMHRILGTFIDIRWNKNSGVMDIQPTKHQQFSHCKGQAEESFFYVPLKHGANCSLLNNNIAKNDKRPMRPCSVVLIQDKNASNFLATQRPQNISFGGKWVLPGGHLQVGQGIVEGGIRQCIQEVGLEKESVTQITLKEMMAWESVYTVDSQIKSTGLVLFFRIKSDKFEVKPQAGQIQKWEWRSLDSDLWGGGWAQGHLTYLRYISSLQR